MLIALVFLWLLKSQCGISPEMKEQFSYRIGVTSPSTEHEHQESQYKLTAVMCSLWQKKKRYEMSKKLCTAHATITAASAQRIRNKQRQHPAESLFSC